MTIIVGTFELHVLAQRSLKGKRQVLRGIIDRIRHRFNVSVAEIGDHELWQRAAIGVACIGYEQHHTKQVMERVASTILENPSIEVLRSDIQMF